MRAGGGSMTTSEHGAEMVGDPSGITGRAGAALAAIRASGRASAATGATTHIDGGRHVRT